MIRAIFADRNPMIIWNMSSGMLLYAMYQYGEGHREAAKNIFYEVYSLCVRGVSLLFDARNARILSQYPDCIALLEIGRSAFAFHAILYGKQFDLGFGYSYPLDLKNYYADFVGAVRRHSENIPPILGYFIDLKNKLNKERLALFE